MRMDLQERLTNQVSGPGLHRSGAGISIIVVQMISSPAGRIFQGGAITRAISVDSIICRYFQEFLIMNMNNYLLVPAYVLKNKNMCGSFPFQQGELRMKVSHTGVITIMLIVIAIALAGCTSTQTSTPQAAGSGQAASAGTGAAGSGAASSGSQGSGSAPAAGSSVSAADIFGSTPASYNWVEYKDTMSGVSGSKTMVVYMKWDKSGACSMRFENPPQGMPASMDCSSTGTTTQNNP